MDYLQSLLDSVQSLPLDNPTFLKNCGLLCLVFLGLGLLFRMFCGRKSNLNHALSAGIGILFLYILGILLYQTSYSLSGLLTTLPFVAVQDGNLVVFSFQGADFQLICTIILRLMILAFFVNLLNSLLPTGRNVFTWLCFRLVTVLLAVLGQTLIHWSFVSILPPVVIEYAPVIVLMIIVSTMLLGALKVLLGIALTAVNPIIGALYTFFFATKIGRQLSNAVLTTALLCIVVLILNHLGYIVFSMASLTLVALLPVIAALVLIWYLVDQVL